MKKLYVTIELWENDNQLINPHYRYDYDIIPNMGDRISIKVDETQIRGIVFERYFTDFGLVLRTNINK